MITSSEPMIFSNIQASKYSRIVIGKLDNIQSADLLLSYCMSEARFLTKDELESDFLDLEVVKKKQIHELLCVNPNIEKCQGTPMYLC